MKYKVVMFFAITLSLFTSNVFADWTGPHKILVIDSLRGDNASFINLKGYENANCDNNRIFMKTSNTQNYNEMLSLVISAFHANTDVEFLIDSNCEADRVKIIK